MGIGETLLLLRVKLLSRYAGLLLPIGLLLRERSPLRFSPRVEGDRPRSLDPDTERGEIERRGGDRVLEGVRDLASGEFCCLERVRPRSGEMDGILYGEAIRELRDSDLNVGGEDMGSCAINI